MDRERLKQFLADFGYVFDLDDQEIVDRLSQEMGRREFEKYSRTSPNQSDFLLTTISQANLVCSFQADVLLSVYEKILQHVQSLGIANSTILDLGCFTGALTALLKHNNPSCSVAGVDRLKKLIKSASQNKRGDYQLLHWDYTRKPPQSIPLADLLICSLGVPALNDGPRALDLRKLRDSQFHTKNRDHFESIGIAWAAIAKKDTRLITVLRIDSLELYLALIDGLSRSGWQPDYSRSASVTCGTQKFPILEFTLAACVASEADFGLHWYEESYFKDDNVGTFEPDRAILRFLDLYHNAKIVEFEASVFPTSPPIYLEIGSTPRSYYVLIRTDDGSTSIKEWQLEPTLDDVEIWMSGKLGISQSQVNEVFFQ